jgi:tRNA(His) 5'-end guanylyltransferase
MGKNTSFGDRMKDYESCYNFKIPNRSYVIIRLDGKGFSKYTKMFDKPFDDILSNVMDAATVELCKYLNPLFAYTQSDEISLVFSTIENIDADLPFDGKVQKLCSISASKVTAAFNKTMLRLLGLFKYNPEEFSKGSTSCF